jgi:hypothetical protein
MRGAVVTRGRKLGHGPGNKYTRKEWAALSRRERDREWSKFWREQPKNKKHVSKRNKKRWREDASFRNSELERSRQQRTIERAELAAGRFERNVLEKAGDAAAKFNAREEEVAKESDEGGKPCRECAGHGRLARTIDGDPVEITCPKCHGKGRLRKKGPPAGLPRVHRFVALPDGGEGWVYSVGVLAAKIGRSAPTLRFWLENDILPGCTYAFARRCYFSLPFMEAVLAAQKRVYQLNGQGRRDMLSRLIREELTNAGESWVPRGGSEEDRQRPGKEGVR